MNEKKAFVFDTNFIIQIKEMIIAVGFKVNNQRTIRLR